MLVSVPGIPWDYLSNDGWMAPEEPVERLRKVLLILKKEMEPKTRPWHVKNGGLVSIVREMGPRLFQKKLGEILE